MRWLTGERALAGAFAALGLLFALQARDLNYMDEFAPGAGFLPFWLGLILLALAIGFLLTARGPKAEEAAAPRAGRKVLAVSVGLAASVALIDWLGFAVAVSAYLLYLMRGVEGRSWGLSVGLAAGTTLGIYLVFRLWLGVPLPQGPWGF